MTWLRTVIALLLGPCLTVQVWALCAGYAPALGPPALHVGALPLYGLLAGVQWVRWWGWQVPALGLGSLVGGSLTLALLWVTWRPQPPRPPATATAQWATARQRRPFTRPGGVVVGKEGPRHG
jgi:hypothetical protein